MVFEQPRRSGREDVRKYVREPSPVPPGGWPRHMELTVEITYAEGLNRYGEPGPQKPIIRGPEEYEKARQTAIGLGWSETEVLDAARESNYYVNLEGYRFSSMADIIRRAEQNVEKSEISGEVSAQLRGFGITGTPPVKIKILKYHYGGRTIDADRADRIKNLNRRRQYSSGELKRQEDSWGAEYERRLAARQTGVDRDPTDRRRLSPAERWIRETWIRQERQMRQAARWRL